MEHLQKLSGILVDKYDMFMFCDDDDTYHDTRVYRFVTAFKMGKNNCNNIGFGGVREYFKDNPNGDGIPEYWCYGIVPDAIHEFFLRFEKHSRYLKHKFGDMYFRHYLRKTHKYYNWVGAINSDEEHKLYKYNINNPNSICGSLSKHWSMYDNILLKILDCRSKEDFRTIVKEIRNDPNVVGEMYNKYEFCKTLYK